MSLPSSTSSGTSPTSSFFSNLPSSSIFTALTSLPSESPSNLSSISQSSIPISPTLSINASMSTTLSPSTLSSLSFSSSSPILNFTSSITTTSLPSSSFSNSLTSPFSSVSSTTSSLLPLSSSLSNTLASATSHSDTSPLIFETTTLSAHTSHVSSEFVWTSTFLTTHFRTSNIPGGTVITVTRISTLVSSGSGVLSTGRLNPNNNPFVHHPGAIVGVTFAVVIVVAFSAIWIFLAHRKHNRMQQAARQGSGLALNSSQEGSWRSPLEDGEDGNDVYQAEMAEQYPGILAALELSHNGEMGGDDSGANNPKRDSVGPRRSSSSGQRPYMTAFGQAAESIVTRMPVDEDGHNPPATQMSSSPASITFIPRSRPSSHQPDAGFWPGSAEIVQGYNRASSPTRLSSSGHSSAEDAHGRSVVSLNMYTSPSSHGHGAASSSSSTSVNGRRSSGPKHLSLTQITAPPTSFGFKGREESDTLSLKGFIGLLRSGRSSTPNIEVSPPPRRSQSLKSHMSFSSPYTSSPSSLLGPQIGNPSNMTHKPSLSTSQHGGQTWPRSGPLTLPSPPSPAVTTDGLPPSEGLLDPRLESLASLADHEDYSRPIGGVVNNEMHSTTTFNTQDTVTTKTDEPDSCP